MSVFSGAKNIVVNGGSIVANAGSPQNLDKLDAEVAQNAILNAGGRADEVRCFPGTREEVIARLEQFMDDESPGRKRMMWLSGPAGAGKSAICQTVAERCSEQGRQAVNFFFFRGDSTRSHSRPLVATLVYQLRPFYPALHELLLGYLEKDPLIGSASIEKQFKQLVSSPFQTIRQSTPVPQQIIIIIDGLDECNNDGRDQDQILTALHKLAHADHSPFLILVSSRAEPQLVMSFNYLGSSVASIFLNEDYQPQKDIRRFVVAKFAEIKKNHHLARALNAEWPTDADIDSIVDKSSNQFIYAATVMRYIQFSSANPALSLLTILEMRPFTGNHNPLSHLDAIYSHIFSKVHNIRAVKLILFARYCTLPSDFELTPQLVGYTRMEIESFFADLVAVIQVLPNLSTSSVSLVFYHASLDDYLKDKSRSTIYYVLEDEIAAELCSMCLRNIHDAYSIWLILNFLPRVQNPAPELYESLLDASTKRLEIDGQKESLSSSVSRLISHIERLYWKHDKAQFKALLQGWSRFVSIHRIEDHICGAVRAQDPSASEYYEQYWMTEKDGQQKMLTLPDFVPVGNARSSTQITSTKVSPNAVDDDPGDSSIHKPESFPQNIPAAPSKAGGSDSAPTGKVKSKTPITPAQTPPNTAGGSLTHQLSARKPISSPQNVPVSPPKSRGGSPAPGGISRSSTPITPARASPNTAGGSLTRQLSARKPLSSSRNVPVSSPKVEGSDSAPAGEVRGKTSTTPARTSPNTVGGSLAYQLSARKPGSSPRNVPVSPPKSRGGSPAPGGISRSSTPITAARASSNAVVGGSAQGLGVRKPYAPPQNTRTAPTKGKGGGSLINRPGRTSRVIDTHKKEGKEGGRGGSGEYDDGHHKLNMIRVKLHYQDDIRIILSAPDTPFSEFVDKVSVKFGKNFDELVMRFKDKDGDKITLRDDSDYEHAIQTARETSKGKAEGALEIWCQDSAQ